MKKKIMSIWTTEIGRYNEHTRSYLITSRLVKKKEIEMEITDNQDLKPILKFIGGPTGHESYYIRDLIENPFPNKSDGFCICGGTINSWPRCVVSKKEVFNFIKENFTDENK